MGADGVTARKGLVTFAAVMHNRFAEKRVFLPVN